MPALTLSEKLDQLDSRYEEMTQQLSTAEAVSDSARFQKLAKQHSELAEIVNKPELYSQYRTAAWERSKTFSWPAILPQMTAWLEAHAVKGKAGGL